MPNGFTPTTLYLLGPSGDQVTELAVSGGAATWKHSNLWSGTRLTATYDALGLHFHLADPLGTRRVQLSTAGAIEQSCWSLPFGDALSCVKSSLATADDATEHHFTGKERDTESGNDYFGVRYYASAAGRWISPDPAKMTIKNLINPQKWNRYAYVRNNPFSLFDPNGLEEVTVQLRAYIPTWNSSFPFKADERGPTCSQNVTSRTSIAVRVETDPAKGLVVSNPGGMAGQSKNLVTGETATQTVGVPTATVTRDQTTGNVNIHFSQNAALPLTPQSLTPGIRSELDVSITPNANSVTTTGTVSGSPAFELNVFTEGGSVNIPLQPEVGTNPIDFGIGLKETNTISNLTPLPPPPPPPPTTCNSVTGACQ